MKLLPIYIQDIISVAQEGARPPIFSKVEELESARELLDKISLQNHLLLAALALIVVLAAVVIVYAARYRRERERREDLVSALLVYQAQALPKFTDAVNKISSRNFDGDGGLYDDLQLAINTVRKGQKTNVSAIVGTPDFRKRHPYLERMDALSDQEKMIVVLFQEGFDAPRIAMLMGMSANGVRAIKTRIRSKLGEAGENESLEILK